MIELVGNHKYKGTWLCKHFDGGARLTRLSDGLQMFIFGNLLEELGKLECVN